MPIELTMPRLSDTMEKGTIIKWNVSEGDAVSSGQTVADIETDKATMEMQVYDDGVMAKIIVSAGELVDVGTVIAVIAEEGEDPKSIVVSAGAKREAASSKASAASESKAAVSVEGESASTSGGNAGESSGNGRLRVSPIARRMADDHGVNLRDLDGSGPGGRIIKRDVQQAIDSGAKPTTGVASSSSAPDAMLDAAPSVMLGTGLGAGLEAGTVALSGMRQTIAKRLVESKQSIPHYQVTMSFNMDPLLTLRRTLNEQLAAQGVKLSVNDFLVRACALAIHHHRDFNASWKGDKLEIHGEVNVGVAIALPAERGGGLVVATIRQADRKGLRQVSAETKQLSEKARTKGLSLEEMSDSTFTISNLGMFGVEHFTAIINPPNAAILAVGATLEKPVVRNGQIVVGNEMQATLSLDHRIIDGATAARYLQTLKQFIENPATLLV